MFANTIERGTSGMELEGPLDCYSWGKWTVYWNILNNIWRFFHVDDELSIFYAHMNVNTSVGRPHTHMSGLFKSTR